MESITNKLFGQIEWSTEDVKSIAEYLNKNPIILFTTVVSPKLINVFHAHLPAIGMQPTLDAKYPKEISIAKSLEEFAKTTNKNESFIKYRVLIAESKVTKVLYSFKGQSGTAKFIELSYKEGEVLNVKEFKLPNINYGKLQSIPMQVVAEYEAPEEVESMEITAPVHELISACRHRFTENLTGYVDVELVPESEYKPTNFREVSIPICECIKDKAGQKWMEQITATWEKNIKGLIFEMSKKVSEAIERYKHTYNDIEKMKALMEEYNELEGELISLPDDSLTLEDAVITSY
jgi:hypothetical protein